MLSGRIKFIFFIKPGSKMPSKRIEANESQLGLPVVKRVTVCIKIRPTIDLTIFYHGN